MIFFLLAFLYSFLAVYGAARFVFRLSLKQALLEAIVFSILLMIVSFAAIQGLDIFLTYGDKQKLFIVENRVGYSPMTRVSPPYPGPGTRATGSRTGVSYP